MTAAAPQPTALETDRLVLSAPQPSDIDEITAACQDPEIQRWTVVPSPYTRSDAEFFVHKLAAEGWASGGNLTWVVRTRADGALVGTQGLQVGSNGPGTAEIGYWVAAGQRGRGYAFEAARAVVDFAFAELAIRRLEWVAYVGNRPSLALAEKLGFQLEGTLRSYAPQRGAHLDAWIGSMLATDRG